METFALVLSSAGILPLKGRWLDVIDRGPDLAITSPGPTWMVQDEEPLWGFPDHPFCVD